MNAPTRLNFEPLRIPVPSPAQPQPVPPNDWQPLSANHLVGMRLAPAQLPVIEAVYAGLGPADVMLQNQHYRLEWVCPPANSRAPLLAKLLTRAGNFHLALDLQGLFPFWPAEGYPITKELLAVHLMEEFAPVLNWLQYTFDTVVTGLQLSASQVPVRPVLSLAVLGGNPHTQGWAHVLDLPTGLDLRRLGERPFPRASREPWQASLLLRLEFCLGHTNISVAELRTLETGDILCIDHWLSNADKLRLQGTLEGASTPCMVLWADERIATVSNVFFQGSPMHGDESHFEGAPQHQVDDLEVTIAFNLGERHIKLGELQALRPGYVFALSSTLNRTTIRIAVNGTTIGAGQLVAVGERLGVRVTRLSGPLPNNE